MNYFIDCGINKGQSITAFRRNCFKGKKWNYIGYDPAVNALRKNSFQSKKLKESIEENSKYFDSFKIYSKAVGAKKTKRIFWYAYGAGSSGKFIKVFKKFIDDILHFRIKRALRFFKFKIVEFENILLILEKLKKNNFFICLKLDIEGHEFEILEEMIKNDIYPDQLLVEYHSAKINYPILKTKEIHKNLYNKNIEIFLWSADDNPPLKKLGKYLSDKDCC